MALRVVLDTNVIFEGLTKQTSACGLIIDAWRAGLITVCVSNSLMLEYEDVLSRKLGEQRWYETRRILKKLFTQSTNFTRIAFSWRPASPDPGDDHVIDCALNASALLITANVKDFAQARQELGLRVLTPVALLTRLVNQKSASSPINGRNKEE